MQTQGAGIGLSEEKISKAKLLNYVEETFARADEDGDGSLNVKELQQFLSLLRHPDEAGRHQAS